MWGLSDVPVCMFLMNSLEDVDDMSAWGEFVVVCVSGGQGVIVGA